MGRMGEIGQGRGLVSAGKQAECLRAGMRTWRSALLFSLLFAIPSALLSVLGGVRRP